MSPTPQPSTLLYSSLPANIIERYTGPDAFLKNGKRFTIAPLWDVFNNTWARTDYDTAEDVLALKGMRMPTFDELDEIANRPDTTILPLCNQPPTNQMATKAWWDKFDLCIQAAMSASGWDGKTPILFGKAWALGADSAHSWLHGFYQPKGVQPGGGYSTIIQNRGKTAHNRKHIDYSQLLYGVEL